MPDSTPQPDGTLTRGTCIEVGGVGLLLRGPSGAGKSDLALRLIDNGAGLVADDYVTLRHEIDCVYAKSPVQIAGLLEIRGLGIVRLPVVSEARLGLVVDLVARDAVPRLPAIQSVVLFGVTLPQLALDPFDASTPAKLRAWVQAQAEKSFRTEPNR